MKKKSNLVAVAIVFSILGALVAAAVLYAKKFAGIENMEDI